MAQVSFLSKMETLTQYIEDTAVQNKVYNLLLGSCLEEMSFILKIPLAYLPCLGSFLHRSFMASLLCQETVHQSFHNEKWALPLTLFLCSQLPSLPASLLFLQSSKLYSCFAMSRSKSAIRTAQVHFMVSEWKFNVLGLPHYLGWFNVLIVSKLY